PALAADRCHPGRARALRPPGDAAAVRDPAAPSRPADRRCPRGAGGRRARAVCSIILITGAGGAFGAILTETGIGGEVAEGLDAMGLPLIVAAYLVSMA